MSANLKDRNYYEALYDRITVSSARFDMKYFMQFHARWFEIMPDEKPNSHRSVFHLNGVYMQMVGNGLLERHDNREQWIRENMAEDKAKDERVAEARLSEEPTCKHCGKTGLRIIDKSLHRRPDVDSEDVLFMLKCTHCQKMSAYWEDGDAWTLPPTRCPECSAVMDKKDARKAEVITTTYKCPSCGHSYKDKIDLRHKKEKSDPNFEKDRQIYCLLDPKNLEEHRDAKRRYDGMIEMAKEFKEREENKEAYDAVANLKKPKIPELTSLLSPALEKENYTEFSLDKPELGRTVTISFNCLDSKTDRSDYDSRNTLRKLINKTLADTNWRLTSDGISYRLGYLTGRIRAYESEEDMLTLVKRTKKKSA